jgi:aspartyl-tRNA(Asn)/glutamyl-tRNA(Gln) amidotransferase subunit A
VNEFNKAFRDFDLLVSPTGPTVAFDLGSKSADPLAMYLNDVLTVAVNLVGVPAISIPAGTSEGLPFGIQLIAPQRAEADLLAAAMATEDVIGDWRQR